MRVVTLNAASLFEPGWPERRVELLAWLERLDPDVVCLQETWEDETTPNTGTGLADDAPPGRWHRVFGGFPLPDEGRNPSLRFGSTILSRWPIEHHEVIPLPAAAPEDPAPHPSWRVQMALLHARTGGVDVFSTHLAPPPTQAALRQQQVVHIDEAIAARTAPDAVLPPVLCGDFNAEHESDEVRFLAGLCTLDGRSTYFQEAWRAAGNQDPGWTWDGRRNPLAARLHLPRKRIDFVFVGDTFGRRGGAGLVERAALAFDEAITGVLASDHFGVVVDIRDAP